MNLTTVYLTLNQRETSLPTFTAPYYAQGLGNDCIVELLLPRGLGDHSNYRKVDWVFLIYEVHQVADKETEVQR